MVKKYLTALRSAHMDMGYDGLAVFHHPQLQRMIAGIRRLRGEPDTKERCPITKDVLMKLLPLFDRGTRGGMTMYAAFCPAFAGFLPAGKFTYSAHDWEHDEEFHKWFLTRRSVRFHNDHIELTLLALKIDQPLSAGKKKIQATQLVGAPIASGGYTHYAISLK